MRTWAPPEHPYPSLPLEGYSLAPERTLTARLDVCLGSAFQTRSGQQDAQLGKVMRFKLGELLFRSAVPGTET